MNQNTNFPRRKYFQEYGEYYCWECDNWWASHKKYHLKNVKTPCNEECQGCGYEVAPHPYWTSYIEAACNHADPQKCMHRRYSWYDCVVCSGIWESAYTYCNGYWEVLYYQECKKCGAENEATHCDYLLGGENEEVRHNDE
eukprot:75937_1